MVVNKNSHLVVNNITERNNISVKTKNMKVTVKDAALDANASGHAEYYWDGLNWILLNPENELLEKAYSSELNNKFVLISSVQQTSANTTLVDISSLSFNCEANSIYEINSFITFRSSVTTTGAKIGFVGPTGSTCFLEMEVPIVSSAAASHLRIIFPSATSVSSGSIIGTGVTAINSPHTARISGLVKTVSSGVFKLQFSSENTGTITLPIGNILQVQKIK